MGVLLRVCTKFGMKASLRRAVIAPLALISLARNLFSFRLKKAVSKKYSSLSDLLEFVVTDIFSPLRISSFIE